MTYQVTELLTQKHVDDMVAMGRLFAAENGPHLDYKEEDVRQTCDTVLKDIDRELVNIFLIYSGETAIGFIFVTCGKYFFNQQRYAQQELLYVLPQYRHTRAFLKLIKAYEEWARIRSAVEIWIGSAHSKTLGTILPRIGYPEVGTYHKKRTV